MTPEGSFLDVGLVCVLSFTPVFVSCRVVLSSFVSFKLVLFCGIISRWHTLPFGVRPTGLCIGGCDRRSPILDKPPMALPCAAG